MFHAQHIFMQVRRWRQRRSSRKTYSSSSSRSFSVRCRLGSRPGWTRIGLPAVMQVNGRLRYERWLAQRGRPETQLELRLEEAIAHADAHAKEDAYAECKRIMAAIEADPETQTVEQFLSDSGACASDGACASPPTRSDAERKTMLWIIEDDAECQAAEQRRKSGAEKASYEERRQLVRHVFDVMDREQHQQSTPQSQVPAASAPAAPAPGAPSGSASSSSQLPPTATEGKASRRRRRRR